MDAYRRTAYRFKISFVWVLVALAAVLPQPARAQDSAVITPDNAAALTTVEHWGRGTTRDVAWSADGQRMAVLTSAGVWLYDVALDTPRFFASTDHVLYSLDISPDGRWLVTGSWDSGAHLWDTVDGSEQALPAPVSDSTYSHWVQSVAFSPDGLSIAAGDYDGWAHVWTQSKTGEIGAPVSVRMGPEEIQAIEFSPDGRTVAGAVRLWSGSPVLWDLTSGQTRAMDGPNRDVTTLAFSPDGTRIVGGSYTGDVFIWNAANGVLRTTLTGLRSFVASVAFSGDGRRVAALDIGGVAQAWSLENGQSQAWPLVGETVPQAIVIAPDAGNTAAFRVALSQLDELRLWTLSPDSATMPAPQVYDGYNWTLWSLAIHPDGAHFASGDRDSTGHIGAPFADVIRLWQTGQAAPQAELAGHEWLVTNLDFNHDGDQLLSGSQDDTARLWSFPDGEVLESLPASEQTLLTTALSPDERFIASGSFDDSVRLWDADGDLIATLPAFRVQAVGFSADSQRLIALNDMGELWQWDVAGISDAAAPAVALTLAERDWSDGQVNAVAFLPDANQVAVGFSNGSVEVWDVDSGARLAALAPVIEGWLANGVEAVAWSPDGALLASGDTEGELRLWDVAAGREIVVLRHHADWITDLAFTPDGAQLLSVSWDGLIRRWVVAS